MGIERDALFDGAGLVDGRGNAEDGVGAEPELVYPFVEFRQVLQEESRPDCAVDA